MNGDPWASSEQSEDREQKEQVDLQFEDSFDPAQKSEKTLADSEEYLKRLETKLERLQSKREAEKQQEGEIRKDLLCSFDTARESCMLRFLGKDSDLHCPSSAESEIDLDAPVANSHILRLVAPERQALVSGELVELLKADELAAVSEATAPESEPKSVSENKS